ncbi:MAG: glycosyltransferase family 2 protein [Methylobacter sp.]
MQNEPFFSIVVPTYNRGHLIKKTLESLLAQTWSHYEIIVVDDGSTDNTEDVVANLNSPCIIYFKKVNAERAAARNYGAQQARGGYVNFFDSDDLALPNHLAEAARMVQEKDDPDWFHLGYAVVTPEGKVVKEVNTYQGSTLQSYIHQGNPLSCNGVFLRADTIKKFPFNEDRALSVSEDYELWYRLAARYPLFYSNIITSWVIDHECRSVRTMDAEKLIVRINLLFFYLSQDQAIQQVFKDKFHLTKARIYSHLALHLSEHNDSKIKSIEYLLKAFLTSSSTISQRTFPATIRNLLLRW